MNASKGKTGDGRVGKRTRLPLVSLRLVPIDGEMPTLDALIGEWLYSKAETDQAAVDEVLAQQGGLLSEPPFCDCR